MAAQDPPRGPDRRPRGRARFRHRRTRLPPRPAARDPRPDPGRTRSHSHRSRSARRDGPAPHHTRRHPDPCPRAPDPEPRPVRPSGPAHARRDRHGGDCRDVDLRGRRGHPAPQQPWDRPPALGHRDHGRRHDRIPSAGPGTSGPGWPSDRYGHAPGRHLLAGHDGAEQPVHPVRRRRPQHRAGAPDRARHEERRGRRQGLHEPDHDRVHACRPGRDRGPRRRSAARHLDLLRRQVAHPGRRGPLPVDGPADDALPATGLLLRRVLPRRPGAQRPRRVRPDDVGADREQRRTGRAPPHVRRRVGPSHGQQPALHDRADTAPGHRLGVRYRCTGRCPHPVHAQGRLLVQAALRPAPHRPRQDVPPRQVDARLRRREPARARRGDQPRHLGHRRRLGRRRDHVQLRQPPVGPSPLADHRRPRDRDPAVAVAHGRERRAARRGEGVHEGGTPGGRRPRTRRPRLPHPRCADRRDGLPQGRHAGRLDARLLRDRAGAVLGAVPDPPRLLRLRGHSLHVLDPARHRDPERRVRDRRGDAARPESELGGAGAGRRVHPRLHRRRRRLRTALPGPRARHRLAGSAEPRGTDRHRRRRRRRRRPARGDPSEEHRYGCRPEHRRRRVRPCGGGSLVHLPRPSHAHRGGRGGPRDPDAPRPPRQGPRPGAHRHRHRQGPRVRTVVPRVSPVVTRVHGTVPRAPDPVP